MSQSLHGIVPPMITPLRDRDALDEVGLERLVEHMVAGGVKGIFVLGTSGEAPHLSYRLRREVIERVCWQAATRVRVLVGITDTSLAQAVQVARQAAEAGAHAVVSSAPYYFPLEQKELVAYFEHLLPKLPLPLYLYNMPQMTKTVFAYDTVARLMEHERIVGIKDSSGDLNYLTGLIQLTHRRPGFATFVGPEHLLADAVQLGGKGGVNGGANVMPHLFVELYEAARTKNSARVAELKRKVATFQKVYEAGGQSAGVIQGLKCALSLMGICRDVLTEPFEPLHGPARDQVRETLETLGSNVKHK
jgi:4-hydroxy-tetrahydrodipicolinate synthase